MSWIYDKFWKRCWNGEVNQWNIRVQHEFVFLRLSLLWGFSEDVLYPDTIRCYFASLSIDICVLHSIFFEPFVSETLYFVHQIVVIVQSVWHSLSLRNNLFLARRKTTIVVWAKPFGLEKLNKRDFELFSPCFFLFWLLTYSPQTFKFSVTVSVVAPANLLKLPMYFWANRITVIRQTANELYQFISSPWLAVSCNSVFYSKFPG